MISKVKELNAWLKYKPVLKMNKLNLGKRNAKLNSYAFANKSSKAKLQ